MTLPDSLGRRAALALGVVALIGVVAYVASRPTDESRIKDQLRKLAVAVRVTEADLQTNPIGRLAHVSDAFEPLFDPEVRVSVPELLSLPTGRRALAEVVTGAPRYVRTFEVDFSDVTVKLDDASASAAVGAVAQVQARDRDGRTRDDRRAVDFRFAKQGGDWLITTVSVWPAERPSQ